MSNPFDTNPIMKQIIDDISIVKDSPAEPCVDIKSKEFALMIYCAFLCAIENEILLDMVDDYLSLFIPYMHDDVLCDLAEVSYMSAQDLSLETKMCASRIAKAAENEYEKRHPVKNIKYGITPKGLAAWNLLQSGTVDSLESPEIDAFWAGFEKDMIKHGYIKEME